MRSPGRQRWRGKRRASVSAVRRTAFVKRRSDRAELKHFTDWKDGGPETQLNFKFCHEATNNVGGIFAGSGSPGRAEERLGPTEAPSHTHVDICPMSKLNESEATGAAPSRVSSIPSLWAVPPII